MRQAQRVEIAMAITSEHLRPGRKILDRKTKRIKCNEDIVITSEFSDGEKIFDQGRANKNIMKL